MCAVWLGKHGRKLYASMGWSIWNRCAAQSMVVCKGLRSPHHEGESFQLLNSSGSLKQMALAVLRPVDNYAQPSRALAALALQAGSNICTGPECFEFTFVVVAAVNASGIVSAAWLMLRQWRRGLRSTLSSSESSVQ